MKRLTLILLLITSLLATASALWAQTAQITGRVTDSTDAVIPEVAVDVISVQTGTKRTAATNEEGYYTVPLLQPGNYRMTVQKEGFKSISRSGIQLNVEQIARIDFTLEVGEITQSIEVSAAVSLLDPGSSSLGQVVDSRKVLDLPLNGRNPLALVALVPGVVPQGASQRAPAGENFFAWGNFQIGGGTTNQSQAYWDGGPLNTTYINLLTLVPTQDSVQEFKVQTNSVSAEFGRTADGIINITSRSGSNEFHGTAYEFLRNKLLNTNTFFNNRAGIERPAFTQNQYGASLGGPLKRDKAFFYTTYEGYAQRRGRSFTFTVPAPEMRGGDFSNLRDARGNLIPIFDPMTTCGRFGNPPCALDANGSEIITRQQFPGNIIPPSRLDRAAVAMARLWALPNVPGQPFTRINNFTANASAGADSRQFTVRADVNLSDKQKVFARYTVWDATTLELDPFGTNAYPIGGIQGTPEDFTTQQIVLGDTYSFSATAVGDFRVSWLRQRYDRFPGSFGIDLTAIGWPAFLNDQVTFRALPSIAIAGINGFSPNAGSVIQGRTEDRSFNASLTKITGRHTLKFGGEVRVGPFNYFQTAGSATGDFQFDRRFTANNPLGPLGGHGFASFMLGLPFTGSLGTRQHVSGQQIYRAVYVQDDWRVTPKLTFNLGLRYEQAGPWSERFGRLSLFLPDAPSPLAGRTGLPLVGRAAMVNSPDRKSGNSIDLNKNMWGPRFGFAYALRDKTVIRGGYGLSWLPNQVSGSLGPNGDPLSGATNSFIGTLDGSLTPFNVLSNPFPNGLLQPPGRDPSFEQTLYGTNVSLPVSDNPYGYQQQWNFNIQQEIVGGIILDAAYAGSKGTHLPVSGLLLNQLSEQERALGSAVFAQVPNPFFGVITSGPLATSTVARGQLLRRYPQYGNLGINSAGAGSSIYHSLQLKVQRRFAGGGSLLAAYTLAKLITLGDDTLTAWLERESGGTGGIQDWNNLRGERSLSSFDVPQRLVVSYAFDLPIGNGKRFLGALSGVPDKLVSGWGFEGITTFQSGLPLRLTATPNQTGSFGGGSRPDSVGRTAKLTGSAQSRLNQWFDTSAFMAPRPFRFGNVARTLPDVRSHGINNWDFALFKNTALAERLKLQFRAEFFNLFNRVQFGFPDQTFGTAQLGVVSDQQNDPRLVQFALRLSW